MHRYRTVALAATLGLWLAAPRASAQAPDTDEPDARTQYPALLANSYFGASLGTIYYAFSERQLEPGYHAQSIERPHPAVRVDLYGRQLSRRLSIQAIYMRPVRYVRYRNVNGDQGLHQVSQAFGGITLRTHVPVVGRVSLWGESGLGLTSRFGARADGATLVREAHYASLLLGAGLEYRLRDTIDLVAGLSYVPGRARFDQPPTRLVTLGLRYWMRPLPPEQVEANRHGSVVFPDQIVRLGYSTSALSYGANTFFSRVVPVFWAGTVETRRGVTLDYQRNVFHTRTRFAFDVGGSASLWKSNERKEVFRTLSVYPLLRFMVHRTARAEYYVDYSLAGPTYLSPVVLDGRNTGVRFTFQDFMGVGAFIGRRHRLNIEIGIKHYSNGNIFTHNAAVKIPLTLTVGRTF